MAYGLFRTRETILQNSMAIKAFLLHGELLTWENFFNQDGVPDGEITLVRHSEHFGYF